MSFYTDHPFSPPLALPQPASMSQGKDRTIFTITSAHDPNSDPIPFGNPSLTFRSVRFRRNYRTRYPLSLPVLQMQQNTPHSSASTDLSVASVRGIDRTSSANESDTSYLSLGSAASSSAFETQTDTSTATTTSTSPSNNSSSSSTSSAWDTSPFDTDDSDTSSTFNASSEDSTHIAPPTPLNSENLVGGSTVSNLPFRQNGTGSIDESNNTSRNTSNNDDDNTRSICSSLWRDRYSRFFRRPRRT